MFIVNIFKKNNNNESLFIKCTLQFTFKSESFKAPKPSYVKFL